MEPKNDSNVCWPIDEIQVEDCRPSWGLKTTLLSCLPACPRLWLKMVRGKDYATSYALLVAHMAIENLNWTSFQFGISRFATICRANSLILSLYPPLLEGKSFAPVLTQKREALQSMSLTCEYQHIPELYKLGGKNANKIKTILDLMSTVILPRGCGSRSVDH